MSMLELSINFTNTINFCKCDKSTSQMYFVNFIILVARVIGLSFSLYRAAQGVIFIFWFTWKEGPDGRAQTVPPNLVCSVHDEHILWYISTESGFTSDSWQRTVYQYIWFDNLKLDINTNTCFMIRQQFTRHLIHLFKWW